MKRKNIVILVLLALVALAGASIYFASKKPAVIDSQTTLTCGMHPQRSSRKRGDCPICGMKLVPLRKQPTPPESAASGKDGADRKVKYYKSTMMLGEISQAPRKDSMGMDMVPVYEGADDSGTISIDPVTTQNMGLRTAVVTKGAVRRNIRTVGAIDFNETALSEVTTKFKGWIEKLYVDSTGQQVHKGEPLFEIYSPDLYSAQSEYVLASIRGVGPRESALTKLKYYDVSDEQIAELERSRQAKKTLSISAPRDGIVVEKMAVEGQMVEAGMKLYRVADLSTWFVQSQVYEQTWAH